MKPLILEDPIDFKTLTIVTLNDSGKLNFIDIYKEDYDTYKHLLDSEDATVREMGLTILSDKYRNK